MKQIQEARAKATEKKAAEDAASAGPPAGHFKQIIPIAEEDNIFDDIDLLEQDPPHRGAAMRNQRFRGYWLEAEAKELLNWSSISLQSSPHRQGISNGEGTRLRG